MSLESVMMDQGLLSYYGFSHSPFGDADAPAQVFRADIQARLINSVVEDVAAAPVVIAVRGEPGVGKTSFVNMLSFEFQSRGMLVVSLTGALHGPMQLQSLIGDAVNVEIGGTSNPEQIAEALRGMPGVNRLVLLFDDADALPATIFHYLSLLVKIFQYETAALDIVLVGKTGLWPGLEERGLEDMRRACFSRHTILALTKDETKAYLSHKMELAGRPLRRVMTPAAVAALFEQADGVPARLERLTKLALVHGYGKARRVTARRVRQALSAGPNAAPTARPIMALMASRIAAALVVVLVTGATVVAVWHRSPVAQVAPQAGVARSAADTTESARLSGPVPFQAVEPSTAKAFEALGTAGASLPVPDLPLAPPVPAPEVAAISEAALAPEAAPAPVAAPEAASAPAVPDDAMPTQTAAAEVPDPPMPADEPAPAAPVIASASIPPPDNAVPSTGTPAGTVPPTPATAPPTNTGLPAPDRRAYRNTTVIHGHASEEPRPSVHESHGGPGLVLVAGARDSMAKLYAKVYRGVTPPPYSEIRAANPRPMKPGTLVIFPEPPNGWVKH